MNAESILKELELLGTEQNKKIYKNHGAHEPLFGVTTGAMKPLAKKIKRNYQLSMELYATGNYDAAFFAGMIADPVAMREEDFEKWMETAYCCMMSEFIVAVTLSETTFAQPLSDKWIDSGKEPYMSTGWSCYCGLLGFYSDDYFDKNKLASMLNSIEKSIHSQPNRTKYAMNNFVIAVGISYLPLHAQAVKTAEMIGNVTVDMGNTSCKTPRASASIQKAVEKGRLGFKRKSVRC